MCWCVCVGRGGGLEQAYSYPVCWCVCVLGGEGWNRPTLILCVGVCVWVGGGGGVSDITMCSPSVSAITVLPSIPVVLGDDYILPFSEKLDWYRASVRVWADSLKEVLEILEEFPTVAVTDMREQVSHWNW